MKLGSFKEFVEAAEPAEDALDRVWVHSRVVRGLFSAAAAEPPKVGRFVLGDKLGVGGMGVVFAARDPELERDVAVKLVQVRDADDRAQTHLEAQALARVSHPNVVAVHDVGLVDDQVYIVMEFVRGQTLRDHAASPECKIREVVSVYRQACAGLLAAHREGLIHRDFKPDNAIIGDDDRVRVIDFGLAHELDDHEATSGAGTQRYMAPEQARGDELTPAVDQFALCASLRESLAAVCGDSIPTWLEAIAKRGTSEKPQDRFANLEALTAALGRDPRVVRRKRILGVGAIGAVVAAFSIGMFASSSAPKPSCEGGAELIEAAWPVAHWQSAAARLSASGQFGTALAGQLAIRFETFRQRWADVHRESCKAHESGAQSDELLDRQMVCLDRAKRAFRTTGTLVTAAKEIEFSQLAVLAQELPRADRCLDLKAITETAPPPPEVAESAAVLAQDLAEVIVFIEAGKFEQARERAKELAQKATTLGYKPLIAEAKLLHGRALLLLRRSRLAIPLLAEASEIAFTAGADRIGVEAWARWAYLKGINGDTASPLAAVSVVRSLAARVGRDTFSSALLENNIGTIHIAAGDYERAREVLTGAAEAARTLEGPGALEAIHAIGNLAMVTNDRADGEHLAAEAVERLRALVGAVHPNVLRAIRNQATLALPGPATALLRPVCELWSTHHPQLKVDAARCYLALAWSSDLVGDPEAAAAASAQVVELSATRYPVSLGLKSLFEGNFNSAIERLEPIAAQMAAVKNAVPWWETLKRAEILLVIGRAYQQLEDRRGTKILTKAHELLSAIRTPLPIVANRIRTSERWLEDRR